LLFPFSFAIGFLLWWLTWGHNGEWVFVYISAVGLPGLAATLYSAFYLDSRASLLNPVLLAMITVLSLVVLDMASVIPLVCLAIVLGLGAISSFAVFRSYRSHLTAFYSLVEGLEKSDEAKSPECESNRESANFEYVPWWGTFLGKSSLPSSDNRDRYYPAILAIGLISLLPAVEFWPAAGLMGQIGAFTIVLGFYAMCFFGIIESSRLRVLKTLPQPRWHIALIDLVVRCLYLSGFALALVVLLVLMKRIDTLPEHLPRIIWLIGFIYPLAGFHFLAQERHLLRFIFTTLLISAIVLLGATGLLRNVLLGPSLILALLSCTFCTFLGLACFRFALTYSEVVDRGKGK
ncbi:MAG: hypothetical protein KC994_21950, partial [Candidatus Omnitrophica bacterium]|nr:hypothetical protein [Candidatus Omnitrophota bacterium]